MWGRDLNFEKEALPSSILFRGRGEKEVASLLSPRESSRGGGGRACGLRREGGGSLDCVFRSHPQTTTVCGPTQPDRARGGKKKVESTLFTQREWKGEGRPPSK